MNNQYGFYINSGICSGCKTCQVACKDKNDLQGGIRFRRVFEISGGGWNRKGETWSQDVFAYNLSHSCNHCEHPRCVDACPTGAMHRGEKGIVDIDPGKCVGCKYCSWACPYDAPRFDRERGIMTKCNLCLDYLQAGRDPACVSACPMRAIEVGDIRELRKRHPGHTDQIYPLPPSSLTHPRLAITPHRDARPVNHPRAEVVNREEL